MQKPKKKLSDLRIKQQVLYIFIFSFVTVLVWIAGSLFQTQRRTGISAELLKLAEPLSPNIDIDLINQIEQSDNFSDQELSYFTIYKIIRSKDGNTERVVPLDSGINEISDEVVQEDVQESILEPVVSN